MWDEAGRGGFKKFKLIPALPCGAGLKSCPIPTPSPLQSETGRGGLSEVGKNCHPYINMA